VIDAGKIRLERSPGYGRYSYAFADGSEAEMNFLERQPGVVTIVHTYTPPQHRGQGVAAEVVKKAIEDFRRAKQKVVPACWFAGEQFRENPGWTDLLAEQDP